MSTALRIEPNYSFTGFTASELENIQAGDDKIYSISVNGEYAHGEIGVIKRFIEQQLGLKITGCLKEFDRYLLDVELIDGGENIYEDSIEAIESVDISKEYGL